MVLSYESFLLDHGYIYQRLLFGDSSDGKYPPILQINLVQRIRDGRLFAVKWVSQHHLMTEYEYAVGRKAYEASLRLPEHLRIIAKTVELLVNGNDRYIVTEYVPGVGLYSVFLRPSQDKITLTQRFYRLLETVFEFERLTGFTHYDLHFNNIITDDNLQTFTLIDFGQSHYPGVIGWASLSDTASRSGAIPCVTDTWFDLARLVVDIYDVIARKLPPTVEKLLDANGFNPAVPWSSMVLSLIRSNPTDSTDDPIQNSEPSMWYEGSDDDIDSTNGNRKLGFWVADGSTACDQVSDPIRFTSDWFVPNSIDSKVLFGTLLACLKERSLSIRPNKDPLPLLALIHDDLLDR